jgi:hypothetical protein
MKPERWKQIEKLYDAALELGGQGAQPSSIKLAPATRNCVEKSPRSWRQTRKPEVSWPRPPRRLRPAVSQRSQPHHPSGGGSTTP